MQSQKVFVKKQGAVCTVFTDVDTNQPVPISSFGEAPAGTFPLTFTSVDECKSKFPGKELVFVEKEKTEQQVVPPVSSAEVQKYLKESKVSSTSAPAPVTNIPQTDDVRSKCNRVLATLKTACKYASKKNQRILLIKIEAVEELIKDVFGE